MSITDELRLFAADPYTGWVPTDKQQADLLAIADRIDAEHERELRETGEDIVREVRREWVRLPVDADGVPIHIGDVVTAKLMFGGTSKPLAVDRMELSRGKDGYLWTIALDTDKSCFNLPKILRHYHAPTVEDVLREFGIDWEHESDCEDRAALLKEYAKRLTLAKEDA